ncbi:MAG: hypothetical protein FWF54_06850 [Candidatus Azobacteroides sp.]|nr:hypothetical protein [Candidatus Azobacteroides sp.]
MMNVNAFLKNKYYLFLYPIIAFLFLLISSTSISPIYPPCTKDDSLFILIGKSILDGKILYKDLFDHKGPVLFYMDSLGQLIYPDQTGAFIYTVINLSIILYVIRKISLFFIKPNQIWIIIASFLSLFFITNEGNSNESKSLLFIFIPLFLILKYYFSNKKSHPLLYSFIYGICSSLVIFIRINNAVALCAIILSLVIFLIINKEWKNLLFNTLTFLFSFILICFIICFYFYINNAFYDMIEGTFLHNLKYASIDSFQVELIVIVSFAITIFALINIYIYIERERRNR